MISINATLILQVIHFLLLAYILNRLLLKPVLKVINDRESHLKDSRLEIENIEDRIVSLQHEFVARENKARKEITKERVRHNQEGLAETEKLMDSSREAAAAMKAEAEAGAQREVEKTSPFLQGEALALSENILEKLIGRRHAVGSESQ